MADPDNEGHPGWVIEQITSAAQGAFNAGVVPDVVLLHAGTNDCNLGLDVTNANARLDELIGNLTDGWPQATILVAKIIPSSDIAVQENIDTYNAQIQGGYDSSLELAISYESVHSRLTPCTRCRNSTSKFRGKGRSR